MRLFNAFLVLLFVHASGVAQPRPTVSPTPLTPDQIAIYRDFLKSYNNGSGSKLNIAVHTQPFVQESWQSNSCLKTLALKPKDGASVHTFNSGVFDGFQIKLIDPEKHQEADPGDAIRRGAAVDSAVERGFAAGVFTYSEVVFDSTHTHAVFSYSFHCGSLCGHGGVVVYDLLDGKWRQSKKFTCGSWIS